MTRGILLAAMTIGFLAAGAGAADKRPATGPATRPGPHSIPGVKADANGYPTGPLPPLAWKPKAGTAAEGRYETWQKRRAELAAMVPDMSERGAARIAKLKAGKINPKQKEPSIDRKNGISFRTEADRQAEVDGMQQATDAGKRSAWEAYDPRHIPQGLPPDSYEWVGPSTKPVKP